ncbi:MAG TPA: hypothetical protein VHX15_15115 [Frankiaceae bacterium]|nr:hypothetical protein [Frankiaceae bacterium]
MSIDPRPDGPVLLVSSSGGVLLELLALQPWWSKHEVTWAAVKAADTEAALQDCRVTWLPELAAARPFALLPAMLRAHRILRRNRPALIVSAGSGPAIPFFLLAAARGIPTFWIATLNVSGRAGLSARLCARLASRVLVQRPVQRDMHPGAVLIGELY